MKIKKASKKMSTNASKKVDKKKMSPKDRFKMMIEAKKQKTKLSYGKKKKTKMSTTVKKSTVKKSKI